MNIGIYGGTFDPPHIGHVTAARAAMEVLGLDKLVNTTGNSALCFRPLEPRMEAHLDIVWKKYQVFSKAAEKFLKVLQETLASE